MSQNFGAEDAERLTPFKDDKPKYTEIMPFQAGSDYFSSANLKMIACSDTKVNDKDENKKSGVHFFVDDYRFKGIYDNPEKTLNKYSQYRFLLTPDFSTYSDESLAAA